MDSPGRWAKAGCGGDGGVIAEPHASGGHDGRSEPRAPPKYAGFFAEWGGVMHDLVIRNANIVDGTGGAAFSGDIAVDRGKITAVGKVTDGARRTIDAGGALVTPGFVDIHTHFDGQVCWDKLVTPSSWHGVTTVVMGNCGVGFAPVRPGTEDE